MEAGIRTGGSSTYIGKSVRRKEDARFLQGQGNYVDDSAYPDAAHAVFVRSPHAHAKITRIDKESALGMPGVMVALTGADWVESGLGDLPCLWQINFSDGRPMNEITRPVLAVDKVCHVGDTVAVVVAETAAQAWDAAESLLVEYVALPVVADTAAAVEPNAAMVHPDTETNLVFDIVLGNADAVPDAFERAAHITRLEVVNNRIAPAPMEPRSLIGIYRQGDDTYTLNAQSQNPHLLRQWVADHTLRVPEHKLQVISPDVGGGFGQKIFEYPEDALVLWASRLVGRPVRWTATRSDNLMVDTYARDHVTNGTMAFDDEGRILALDINTIASVGAYINGMGAGICGAFYPVHLTGLYDIPAVRIRLRGVYTNTAPTGPYRGAGQPEAAFILERLVDTAAREMNVDPFDLRSRSILKPDQFPHTSAMGRHYDSGNYPGLIELTKAESRYEELRREQREWTDGGLRMGIGIACVLESTGGPSSRSSAMVRRLVPTYDSAICRVHPSGMVTVMCGAHSHGQGHATVFAQIAAEMLGCDIDNVDIVEGDTDRVPFGLGTFGSRSLLVAGIAITKAVEKVIDKGAKIAAHVMECDVKDVEFDSGRYTISGTNRSLAFADVARAAYMVDNYPEDLEPGLDETAFYDPPGRASTSGMHMCVVLVDLADGTFTIRDYWSIDDVGRAINPMIVEGQLHGGMVQGLGQVLMENCVYDESGQLLTGTFMDYAMPRADDVPSFTTVFQETLCQDNALGARGVGESGAIGPPPAVVNAVVDALADLGVRHIDMPLTPERVWKAIRDAAKSADGGGV